MIEELMNNRSLQPLRVIVWTDGDEAKPVLCPVCGWKGRLGDCPGESFSDGADYCCPSCDKMLVVRARSTAGETQVEDAEWEEPFYLRDRYDDEEIFGRKAG